MELSEILLAELKGSVEFFLDYTNLDRNSSGYGLTVDSTKKPGCASIASSGFALTAWVIAVERGFFDRQRGLELTRGTLQSLLQNASHYRGFYAHYLHMNNAQRWGKCEFSTIDTALCLNGVITAAAYFRDAQINELAAQLLERTDWNFLVFTRDGKTLFRMAYNPDARGDYVHGRPGLFGQWDMAAEQKMMYLQAACQLDPALARELYRGFSRDIGIFNGQQIIVNPGGNLFAYQFSEAWLDVGSYLDPDNVDWFQNTRLAALANRSYCMKLADRFKTYHANSWGMSAGDSPWGYDVSGSEPCLHPPKPNGTVSIYSALSCLPFIPSETASMILHLYHHQPHTWGKYGFFDAYNLSVTPAWHSQSLYGIDKGCSMIMIENHLSRLIWDTYTSSSLIQKALRVLGFKSRDTAGRLESPA